MLITLWLMMQAQSAVAAPFFSNDFEGWVKLAGVGFAIIGAVWWFLRDPFIKRIDSVEKVQSNMSRKLESLDTRVTETEVKARLAENNIAGLEETYGMLTKQLDRHLELTSEIKDMIGTTREEILTKIAYSDGQNNRRSTDKH